MGKSKKEASTKDDKQQSIASFFKVGTSGASAAGAKRSRLFTSVDKKVKVKSKPCLLESESKGKVKPGTSDKEGMIIVDTPPKGKKPLQSIMETGIKKKLTGIGKSIQKNDCQPENSTLPKKETDAIPSSEAGTCTDNGASLNLKCDSKTPDVTLIPDTQETNHDKHTPKHPFTITETEAVLSPQDNDDSLMIPDTPDNVLSKTLGSKKRACASKQRNFLSSTVSIMQPVKFLNSVQMKNKMANIRAQEKNTRSFEEAYKEMLNADGGKLEKADLSLMLGHMGPLFPQKSKPTNVVTKSKDCNSSGKRKAGTGISLTGMKRTLSKGESPSAKRANQKKTPLKHSVGMSYPGSVEVDKACRRKLSLEEVAKNMEVKRSKDSVVKLCDDDEVLADILNEMKAEVAVPSQRKSVESNGKVETAVAGPAVEMQHFEEVMDEDDGLDDIMAELKYNIMTQSNKKIAKKTSMNRSRSSSGGFTLQHGVGTSEGMLKCTKLKANSVPEVKPSTSSRINCGKSPCLPTTQCCDIKQVKKSTKTSHSVTQPTNNMSSELVIGEFNAQLIEKESTKFDQFKIESGSQEATEGESQQEVAKSFNQLSPLREMPPQSTEERKPPCSEFGRYTVTEIMRTRSEIQLHLKSDFVSGSRRAILRGFWMDTHVNEEDIVNIIGDFDEEGVCYVTNEQNMVIIQPDHLISGTTIVSCVHCMRQAVLNEKFKGYEGKNIYMLYGSIIHCIFQEVLHQKAKSATNMRAIAEKIVNEIKFLHDMYGQMYDEVTVMEEVDKYIPQMLNFANKHAAYRAGYSTPGPGEVAITQVADIEENVWSPRYGIKGKIDLTVEVKIQAPGKRWSKKVVPLELKTGRPSYSIEHKGQVTLYTMMSSDRRTDPESGLLLYLKDGSMKTIPAEYANKRGLIQLRNELAYHQYQALKVSDKYGKWTGGLPEPINNPRSCAKCPQLLNCCLYQKEIENWEPPQGHGMQQIASETLEHLTPSEQKYYAHWVRLLHQELSTSGIRGAATKDLWCKTAQKRENEGQCLSSLVLDLNKCSDKPNDFGQYTATLYRHSGYDGVVALCDVGIGKGESVVVSADNKLLLSLALASIVDITETTVTVLSDRNLQPYEKDGQTIYRLDKCDAFNTMAINFSNLTRLMESTVAREKLRQLIIDQRKPEFDLTMSKAGIEKVKPVFKHLNKPQKTAILKVLMSKDYVLIKGYPGTGKTSTIVALVQMLVKLGHSVLLASYTHSAVDNLLLKLKKHDVDFVRIGRSERIHPEIQAYSAELLTKDFTSVAALDKFYLSKSVVATTCMGTNHAVFTRRMFDVCIIDEASQVLQPACLGPLYCSKRFVLVGDPLQLPPIVQSKEARDAGMSESLFARLDDAGGTYELNLQYRMNSSIMRLSNELVYSGALKCGTAAVASQKLKVTNWPVALQGEAPWVCEALSPAAGLEVVFLDTDKMLCPDDSTSAVKNAKEASVISILTEAAVKVGLDEVDIGVISPYRQQVSLLRDLLKQQGHPNVEVNTVDQYQGRDKAVIFISFVKSSADGHVSEILRDVRRLNVALTRAKYKMILVGSKISLVTYVPLAKLLQLLDVHQIIDIL